MNEWMNGLKCESNSLILYFFDEEIVRKWQNNNENKKSKFFFINRILIISNQTHTHNLSTIFFLNDKNKFSICLTSFGGYFFLVQNVWQLFYPFGSMCVCVDMWFVRILVVQMVKCKDRCCSLFFYIHTYIHKRTKEIDVYGVVITLFYFLVVHLQFILSFFFSLIYKNKKYEDFLQLLRLFCFFLRK